MIGNYFSFLKVLFKKLGLLLNLGWSTIKAVVLDGHEHTTRASLKTTLLPLPVPLKLKRDFMFIPTSCHVGSEHSELFF